MARTAQGKTFMILAIVAGAAACLPASLASPADAEPAAEDAELPDLPPPAAAPRILAFEVQGHDGSRQRPDEAPRRPVLTLEVEGGLGGDLEPVALLVGGPDAALVEDARRPPLASSRDARRVPSSVHRALGLVTLTPLAPLEPGARYTLLVGGWARHEGPSLGEPFVREVQVRLRGGGAALTDAWPADGTAGVPAALPFAALRFDEGVRGAEAGLRLLRSDGEPVPSDVTRRSCEALGWPDGDCLVVTPRGPLAVGRRYELALDAPLRDLFDAPLGAERRIFTTATATPPPLELVSSTCGLDEVPVDGACMLVDDGGLGLRLVASGPTRAFLDAGVASARAVAPRGELELSLVGLTASAEYDVALRLVDLAGTARLFRWPVRTTPPLLPVSITEVRFDPNGPEPRQEYVEVINSGAVPVDLAAATLSDRADRPGDVLMAPARVPAGARALIVADGFDPDHADDPTTPPGVVLIRVGSSIGSGGLSNSGEPLYLRDASGRRLSAAPAVPSPGGGHCLVRVSDDPRTGAPSAFVFTEPGQCTPGADRLPAP